MESTQKRFDSLIYKDFVAYQELSPGDQLFFDKLFDYLIYYGEINWSNSKICVALGETESTLEKRLKRVEEARLILRETSKQYSHGVWRTVDRIIRLNPFHFQFDFNTMAHRIFVNYLFHKQTEPILNKYLEMPYDEFIKAFGKVKVHNV